MTSNPTPTPLASTAMEAASEIDREADFGGKLTPANAVTEIAAIIQKHFQPLLAKVEGELQGERNMHDQTRVVVEELNIICNDLRNAGKPQFIRSEAIRLLRDEVCALRADLAAKEAALEEALVLAEALNVNMDYLGTGSDGEQADREQQADAEKIKRLRSALASRADKGGAR